MNDIAELWWVVLAILCAAVLFVFAFRIWVWLSSGRRKNDFSTEPARCPLCNSFLRKGEKLVSRVYRNAEIQRPEGQRCVILGCPHCYPVAENALLPHEYNTSFSGNARNCSEICPLVFLPSRKIP